jgi:hypothetical protein
MCLRPGFRLFPIKKELKMLENQLARESYIAKIKQQLDDLADRIRRRLEAVTQLQEVPVNPPKPV